MAEQEREKLKVRVGKEFRLEPYRPWRTFLISVIAGVFAAIVIWAFSDVALPRSCTMLGSHFSIDLPSN